MKRRLVSLALVAALLGAFAFSPGTTSAAQNKGGAAGVVAALVQIAASNILNNSTIDVAVVELNNSLNNLTALNNVLNNSPILSNNEILKNIDINVQDVYVLNNNLVCVCNVNLALVQAFLEDNNIALTDVVGVAILSGGDFIVFTQ